MFEMFDLRHVLPGGNAAELESRPVAVLLLATAAITVVALVFRPGYAGYGFATFLALAAVGWYFRQATTAYVLAFVATLSALLTIGFIIVFLFLRASPAVVEHGPGLFTRLGSYWDPASGRYSLVAMIWGTALTTVIAGVVAAPLGVLGALYISEIASPSVRETVKPGIEILAGIPSIVYGYIGFMILNDYARVVWNDGDYGSFLMAGVVIGVMALPTVVSVSEDALESVPDEMRDGSVAMGATQWQTMKSISLPAAVSGISAAIILGIGRAIGETMAAASILGAHVQLPAPLWDAFATGSTLTTLIATHFGNASGSSMTVLFVAGVLLFVIVAILSVISQIIERRMKRRLQGES
ncbi:MAG: phosphate transport system permease protein [Haloarculaceae archaeon]|jgi:phosphate transport system permease protein